MKLKLSLPDLRRLAEVLVESVHLGRTRDIRLRDRLLNAIRDEMNLPYRRRRADRAAVLAERHLQRVGHKGL